MKWVLRLKHWQIFLIRLLGYLPLAFSFSQNEILGWIIKAIAIFILYGWFVLIGLEIIELSKKRILSTGLFIFNNLYARNKY